MFKVIVAKVIYQYILLYILWHTGITVDSCYCGIMYCYIVLQVFRASVAKLVYHYILPYTLWHIGITIDSCYYGIMYCYIVL